MQGFDVNWLLSEVQKEVAASEQALLALQHEIAAFLPPPSPSTSHADRPRRALPLAAAAVGAIGLFGTGIAMGSGDCGLSGIFGTCQSRENADAINRMFQMTESLAENLQHIHSSTNEKFFVVGKELQAIRDLQQQMADIQNANWQTITAQFEAFRDDIHRMRNCDQLLFTRQQINFNFDTVASLLSLFYSNVKSYRAALFAYRLNLLNSLPALLNKFVPMSLLDRPSLEKVLTIVQNIQNKARDRLTLAIPFQETLSYYESQLLQDIVALPEGLLITMSIPLASRQTVLTTYEAIPLPMPQHDDDMAMIWDTHADFLAVSEDGRETASVSRQQLDQCIGSSRYSICQQGFATEGSGSSCLSLLFFGNLVQAMKVCDLIPYQLPIIERAINLKFGIWLILSAEADFELRESASNDTAHLSTRTYPGCRICIYTLPCGHQLRGPNIFIRSDLQSCSRVPSIKIHVDIPDPLQNVLSVLPSIEELPSFSTKSSANLAFLRSLKKELKYIPQTSLQDREALQKLAEPIVMQMTSLKNPFKRELSHVTSFTSTIVIGIASFIISMLLHLLFMYIFHRCNNLHKFMPFKHVYKDKDNVKRTIPLKPVLSVPTHHMDILRTDPRKCLLHENVTNDQHYTTIPL